MCDFKIRQRLILYAGRSFFLIDLPCRADMVKDLDIEEIVHYNDTKESGDFTKDFIKDFTKENSIKISERQYDILFLLTKDRTLTSQKISQKKPVSMRTILKDLAELQQKGFIRREGGRKTVTGNYFSCHWTN